MPSSYVHRPCLPGALMARCSRRSADSRRTFRPERWCRWTKAAPAANVLYRSLRFKGEPTFEATTPLGVVVVDKIKAVAKQVLMEVRKSSVWRTGNQGPRRRSKRSRSPREAVRGWNEKPAFLVRPGDARGPRGPGDAVDPMDTAR